MAESFNRIWVEGDVAYMEIVSPKYGIWITKFDADRVDEVAPHRWCLAVSKEVPRYVACTRLRDTLHGFLFPCETGKLVRDHINKDRFDNRSSNIRITTYSQNNFNTLRRKRLPGVHKKAAYPYFYATINLGRYKTEEEAHEAWKKAWAALGREIPLYV